MKRTYPDTSHDANAAKTEESKQRDYEQIEKALRFLGLATYEQIADFLNWDDPNKVSRRMLEMMPPTERNPKGLNKVYKPGSKGLTKRNCSAYHYALVAGDKSKAVEHYHVHKSNEKSVSDFASNLINMASKPSGQTKLF